MRSKTKPRVPRSPLTAAEREVRLTAFREWVAPPPQDEGEGSPTYHAKQAALFRRHGMDWRADYHEQRAKEAM